MNPKTERLFAQCLEMTGGDRAAAGNLALADALLSQPKVAADQESYTVPQTARLLALSKQTVYRMCREGNIDCFHSGRTVRITKEGIEQIKGNCPPPRCRPRAVGIDHLA